MAARDRDEHHRTATPLELLFDLCFVVAVASASDRLHHALAEGHLAGGHLAGGHIAGGIVGYLLVFFAIWWAWMNFTWFASAYDSDDLIYRLATFVQIAGVLVLAAGVPAAFDARDFVTIYIGYLVMRVGLVSQWLRAARGDPGGRTTAVRYSGAISACMLGWAGLLVAPMAWRPVVFVVMAMVELAVPIWAEHTRSTPWHPRHIAERYGLFTLIVLGETILAATAAVKSALDLGNTVGLLGVATCGLVIVLAMWWIYFGHNADRFLRTNRQAFLWGYGHYLILSSAGAVGAGLGVAVDRNTPATHVDPTTAGAAVAVPVAVFVVSVWLLHVRPHHLGRGLDAAYCLTATLVLMGIATPVSLPLTATLLVALVATCVVATHRQPSPSRPPDRS